MKHLYILFISIILITAPVFGEKPMFAAEQVVERHMTAASGRDLNLLMRDYAADAVLITPDGIYKGTPEIQSAFAQLLSQEPYPVLTMTKQVYADNIGYIVWTMKAGESESVNGSDTFIVRDDKIIVQTVVIFP